MAAARPPVGLSAEALDPAQLEAAVANASHGAVVTFLGTTRATSPDDPRTPERMIQLRRTAATAQGCRFRPRCRYAIDALKSRVAVWKREVYADGGGAWIANATRDETR